MSMLGASISTPHGAAVRARRLAGDGTPLGPASGFPVATSVPAVNLGRTNAVARADAVGYVSAWESFGANYTQIYAQAISPFSDRILGPLYAYPVDYGNSWNRDPDIACAPWGTCLVVYESDEDILARLIEMHVFGDHFESGTTSAWSAVAPQGADWWQPMNRHRWIQLVPALPDPDPAELKRLVEQE